MTATPHRAATGAERQAKYAARGRAVAVIIRDPQALAALAALERAHGGVTAAITAALRASAARKAPRI